MPYPGVPLHPKRRRVMGRNWAAEPEKRMLRNLKYRTKYGLGLPAPSSFMIQNLREQEEYRHGDYPPA
jgi:hypothetical protein